MAQWVAAVPAECRKKQQKERGKEKQREREEVSERKREIECEG